MLLIHPIQELPRALPALLAAFVAGNGSGQGLLWSAAALVITLGFAFSRWFTTRYRITEDRVEVGSGLFQRRVRAVSRDRIRTVDVTARAMHRLLGLARVDDRHRAVGPRRRRRRAARRPHRGRGRAACARSCCIAASRRRRPRRSHRRGAGPGARDRAGAPGPHLGPLRALHALRPGLDRRGRRLPRQRRLRDALRSRALRPAARSGRPPRPRAGRAHRRGARGPRRWWPWWWPRRSATHSRSGTSGSRATPEEPCT